MKRIPNKTTHMKAIETKLGGGIEETLRRLFVDENKSLYEIAQILGVSYVTVVKWLALAGVYSRRLHIKDAP